ncbi:MAG TPA: Gfo/Idh/MocA family oxidoreductase, partial [Pirellulaceae bacterium]|nr:Gfo/Idh/MocA family oxidoreductase [Pirellulaceae bacterium]
MTLDLSLNYLPQLPQDKSPPIGCIGSGFIMADCHLVAYRKAGFNPVAIASRTPAHARRVAERHGLTAYDTYQEMLASGKVEVVDIAVPPDTQIDVIREVARHKKHIRGILAQKPLGVSYEQAKEIVQLCKRAKITLAVNQNMRYDQSVRACKDLLSRGLLGEPVLA